MRKNDFGAHNFEIILYFKMTGSAHLRVKSIV